MNPAQKNEESLLQLHKTFSVIDPIRRIDRTLLWAGVACLVMVPFSILFTVLDNRVLDGANVWIKPMKFQISVGIFLLTLAVMLPLAGTKFRKTTWGRTTVWMAVAMSAFEIFWITLQAARAERSHYNDENAFYNFMYVLMGIGAVLLSITPVSVAIASSLNRLKNNHDRIIRWAMCMGVVASLVGSVGIGTMLGGEPKHYPNPDEASNQTLPIVEWQAERGDLRIAHFVGLHAFQGIFVLGFLMSRCRIRLAYATIAVVTLAWIMCTLALAQIAINNQAPWAIFQ